MFLSFCVSSTLWLNLSLTKVFVQFLTLLERQAEDPNGLQSILGRPQGVQLSYRMYDWQRNLTLIQCLLLLLTILMILLLFCCSVTKSCHTFWDPMGCSMSGLSVLHHLLEFAQTHIHWVSDAIQPSYPLLPSSPFALNLSQHLGLF